MSSKKLTVLFADLVGSTKLSMGLDSDSDYRLKSTLREEFERRLPEYNGVFRKSLGDGFLISFDNATEAVRYAIDVQNAIQSIEIEELDDPVAFRMGLHTGTVTVDEEDDIHGPVVKIAEGVEDRSRPDEIFLTSTTYRDLDRDAVDLDRLGERSLKGMDEEITLFRLIYEKQRSDEGGISLDRFTPLSSKSGMLVGLVGALGLTITTLIFYVFVFNGSATSGTHNRDDQFESRVTSFSKRDLRLFGRPSSPREYEGLIVTRVFNDGTDELIELYNPTSVTQYLLYIEESSPGIERQFNETVHDLISVPPCGYLLNVDISSSDRINFFDNNRARYHLSRDSSLGSNEGVRVASMSRTDTEYIYDGVGWFSGEKKIDAFVEGRSISSDASSFYLKRKRNKNGFPIDTNNNRSDFEVDTGIPRPRTGYSAPGCKSGSRNG